LGDFIETKAKKFGEPVGKLAKKPGQKHHLKTVTAKAKPRF
jgi:hypothetical protein